MSYFHLHRTLCDVLEEMRACWKTRNFAPMKGLIEEAQGMGNNMEASLYEIKDLKKLREQYLLARQDMKELNEEKAILEAKVEKLRGMAESGLSRRS